VGGGLAGIAAALELRAAGSEVLLIETRPVLGGLVRSFDGRDNGQHIFLGCCRRLMRLLDRLRISPDTALQARARIPVVDIEGRIGVLGARGPAGALAPLLGLATYSLLRPLERASIVRALARLPRPERAAATQGCFADWLREQRQGPRARRYFWDLVTTPSLNAPPERVATGAAAFVLRQALFGGADALRVGWARRALTPWIDPASRAGLRAAGVELRLGCKVRRIVVEGRRVAALELDGETLGAGRVVLAVPPRQLAALLPEALARSDPFRAAGRIDWGAIVGVHLRYDRTLDAPAILAAPDSPCEWIFDAGGIRGESKGAGQELSVVLSDAQGWLRLSADEIVRRLSNALPLVLPRAAAARLVDATVHREPRATIVPSPRCEALRPPQATPIAGLALAGAWTDTGGWPSTMEGAVISGERAAAVLRIPI